MTHMKAVGTEYGATRIKKMTNPRDHKGVEMFMKYQTDWLLLSKYQQQLAKQNNSIVYRRYMLSQKYGKQIYNYLSNGGIREIHEDYIVLWDSEKDQ